MEGMSGNRVGLDFMKMDKQQMHRVGVRGCGCGQALGH